MIYQIKNFKSVWCLMTHIFYSFVIAAKMEKLIFKFLQNKGCTPLRNIYVYINAFVLSSNVLTFELIAVLTE